MFADFSLCFEAPLPSSSTGSNHRSIPTSVSGGGSECLPMLSPGDTTPLKATPVFQTPPNSSVPPPYVQPKPEIWSSISTPSDTGPPPPYVQPKPKIHSTTSAPSSNDAPLPPPPPPSSFIQPTLGSGSVKLPPGPRTPANQGVPRGGSGSCSGSNSSSGSSFLTPGICIHTYIHTLYVHCACSCKFAVKRFDQCTQARYLRP